MKDTARTFLVGGGILGLFVTAPISYFVWKMRGALSPDEQGYMAMMCYGLPGLCIVALLAGILWKEEAVSPPCKSPDEEKSRSRPPEDNARDVT